MLFLIKWKVEFENLKDVIEKLKLATPDGYNVIADYVMTGTSPIEGFTIVDASSLKVIDENLLKYRGLLKAKTVPIRTLRRALEELA